MTSKNCVFRYENLYPFGIGLLGVGLGFILGSLVAQRNVTSLSYILRDIIISNSVPTEQKKLVLEVLLTKVI